MKLTSLLRLSFAILILAAASAQAKTHSFEMTSDATSTARGTQDRDGWHFYEIGASGGYTYFNLKDDYMYFDFADPVEIITNVVVSYKCSAETPARILRIIPRKNEADSTSEYQTFNGVKKSTTVVTTNFNFAVENNYSGIKIYLPAGVNDGTSGNWTILNVVFNTTAEGSSVPFLSDIADGTVYVGATVIRELQYTATDNDPILSSNVTVKADTESPKGDFRLNGNRFVFEPASEDLGKTFYFVAEVEDKDGTASSEFAINVALAAPVLKAVLSDDLAVSPFTIALDAESAGATEYTLVYYYVDPTVTNTVEHLSYSDFPQTFSDFDADKCFCRCRAVNGTNVSEWSNEISYPADFQKVVPAVKMTELNRVYRQNFNSLPQTGDYWFDGFTLPGWYATTAATPKSYDGEPLVIYDGGATNDFIFSATSYDNDPANRALGARAKNSYSRYAYGIVFTNTCSRPVTNITVKFTGVQFRQVASAYSTNCFYYAKNRDFFDLTKKKDNFWFEVPELAFGEIVQGTAKRLEPPKTISRSASIPLLGANALKPGETFAIKWCLNVPAGDKALPALGIDDVEITWNCAWQKGLVISFW